MLILDVSDGFRASREFRHIIRIDFAKADVRLTFAIIRRPNFASFGGSSALNNLKCFLGSLGTLLAVGIDRIKMLKTKSRNGHVQFLKLDKARRQMIEIGELQCFTTSKKYGYVEHVRRVFLSEFSVWYATVFLQQFAIKR